MYEIDGILYAGKPSEITKVIGIKVLDEYKLLLTFSTGERKVYDAAPLLDFPVFQPLRDKTLFNSAALDFDTVTWCNGDIDIAPETLYHDSFAYCETAI